MKLTIYTTANSEYFPFTYMFVSSIKDNFPEEKLNKIIINDLGLSQVQRNRLSGLCSKIEYIKTVEENVGELTVHTEKWRKAVDQKTLGLQEICKEENYPIVMIDSDTYVLKDFSDEIFDDCDSRTFEIEGRTTNENPRSNLVDFFHLLKNVLEFVDIKPVLNHDSKRELWHTLKWRVQAYLKFAIEDGVKILDSGLPAPNFIG